ncbi:MAG: hypothetical protein HAW67_01520 [Endozoicomonadaceae bacterium]|nr:hypothetical protein [Endozoicomonadaceae bacterium]
MPNKKEFLDIQTTEDNLSQEGINADSGSEKDESLFRDRHPQLLNAALNKLYFKNRDGSVRDDVGVYEIGYATIKAINDDERITLDVRVKNSTDIGSHMSLILTDVGIAVQCDKGICFFSINDLVSRCSIPEDISA